MTIESASGDSVLLSSDPAPLNFQVRATIAKDKPSTVGSLGVIPFDFRAEYGLEGIDPAKVRRKPE